MKSTRHVGIVTLKYLPFVIRRGICTLVSTCLLEKALEEVSEKFKSSDQLLPFCPSSRLKYLKIN